MDYHGHRKRGKAFENAPGVLPTMQATQLWLGTGVRTKCVMKRGRSPYGDRNQYSQRWVPPSVNS